MAFVHSAGGGVGGSQPWRHRGSPREPGFLCVGTVLLRVSDKLRKSRGTHQKSSFVYLSVRSDNVRHVTGSLTGL